MAKITPGHPLYGSGRPAGSRNRLTVKVFEDVLKHWNELVAPNGKTKGQAALELMMREKPNEYVRAIFSLLPREFVIENVMSDIDDEGLDELLDKSASSSRPAASRCRRRVTSPKVH